MTPLLIDSAYVIALVNRRDQYHLHAKRLAHQYRNTPLVVTEGVLLEIGNSLAGRFRNQAAQVIGEFIHSSQVEIVYTSPQLLIAAIDLYKQMSDKEWGLVDCLSFVVMRERGLTDALTSDHHFVQAGFSALFANPK